MHAYASLFGEKTYHNMHIHVELRTRPETTHIVNCLEERGGANGSSRKVDTAANWMYSMPLCNVCCSYCLALLMLDIFI